MFSGIALLALQRANAQHWNNCEYCLCVFELFMLEQSLNEFVCSLAIFNSTMLTN